MTRNQANLMLLVAGALWGAGFIAQSTAMANLGPLQFIGFRFLAATLAVLPFAMREARRAPAPLPPAAWRGFLILGLLLFAGMTAQQYGLLYTTVTNSGFLTGLYVVLVPFLAVLLFRETPHPIVWPAAFVALVGIWMLSGGSLHALTLGDWLTILCAAIWALQLIATGRLASGTGRPITLAVTQFAFCAALGLVFGLVLEPVDGSAVWRAMPEILYAGVISGGLAFTLQAIAQRYTSSSTAAILMASESIFAALFGALILGDRLTPFGLVGCALIFAAIVAVEALPPLLRKSDKTSA